MSQLAVNSRMPTLIAGQLIGQGHELVTRFNKRMNTRTATVTYAGAGNFSLTIEGTPYGWRQSQSKTLTVAGSTNSATTAAALATAIAADAVANAMVSVSRLSNVLTLTARQPGSLSITASATGGGNGTVVATTVSEEQLRGGVVVVKDSDDLSIRAPYTPTAQVSTVTADAATNSKLYSFVLRMLQTGVSYLVEYTADGSATTTEIAAGLAARVNALPVPVTASAALAVCTLTADVAGDDFEIQEVDSELSVAASTANVRPAAEGITVLPRLGDISQALTGLNVYPVRSDVSVCKRGPIGAYCEVAMTPADKVFYRVTANGALTVLGALRSDSDSGNALPLEGASIVEAASAGGVAHVRLNLS